MQYIEGNVMFPLYFHRPYFDQLRSLGQPGRLADYWDQSA